jgi:hypothetical protein
MGHRPRARGGSAPHLSATTATTNTNWLYTNRTRVLHESLNSLTVVLLYSGGGVVAVAVCDGGSVIGCGTACYWNYWAHPFICNGILGCARLRPLKTKIRLRPLQVQVGVQEDPVTECTFHYLHECTRSLRPHMAHMTLFTRIGYTTSYKEYLSQSTRPILRGHKVMLRPGQCLRSDREQKPPWHR